MFTATPLWPAFMTTFCGAQVRYLVHSAHGYLGAVGFSAAALRLASREAWTQAQRQAFLYRVLCLSRFLIRGRCPHLASHVLGRVLRRLPEDMEERYGYRPWIVETYVDPAWDGTCFKAAKFQHIGYTAGGRRSRPRSVPKRCMYMNWMAGGAGVWVCRRWCLLRCGSPTR